MDAKRAEEIYRRHVKKHVGRLVSMREDYVTGSSFDPQTGAVNGDIVLHDEGAVLLVVRVAWSPTGDQSERARPVLELLRSDGTLTYSNPHWLEAAR